jgi:hypothetical protein
MTLNEAADYLGISPRTLRLAAERQEIPNQHPLPDGPWVFNKADLDAAPARELVERAKQRKANLAVPNPHQQTLGFSDT